LIGPDDEEFGEFDLLDDFLPDLDDPPLYPLLPPP